MHTFCSVCTVHGHYIFTREVQGRDKMKIKEVRDETGCVRSVCQVKFKLSGGMPPLTPPLSLWLWGEGWCLLLVGCITSQQHASVSQGRIFSDNCTCCHSEIEVADQTFYLAQSKYTNTGPTSPSADPVRSGAWQGSH